MTDTIHIDGSQGEGGGQIVRSSLALSMVTGKPVSIVNIRAGRKKPGLMRQHLTGVNAATQVCGAEVKGAGIGSQAILFTPDTAQGGEYHFSIGTAGSATLVLQTVLPALMIADAPSRLTLEGGTHNQWAPPFDFLERAYLPLINRMGPRVSARLQRHGFYPAGGGRFTVDIEPAATLRGFNLLEPGEVRSRSATALVSNLPRHIGQREVDTIIRRMNWNAKQGGVEEVDANGPGNTVFAAIDSEQVCEVFTAFGRVGIRAEHVAKEVVNQVRDYFKADVPVGPYLADQLLLPLGISAWQSGQPTEQRGGAFRTMPLTRHSETHIEILREFLDVQIDALPEEDSTAVLVTVKPSGELRSPQ